MDSPDATIDDRLVAGSWRTSFGLALILAGQPIAWFVRGFLNSESPVFPASIVLLGLLMLVRVDRLRRPAIHVDIRLWAVYALVFVLPVAAMSLVDTVYLLTDWTYGFFLFIVLMVLAVTPRAQFRPLPMAFTIVGLASCLGPLIDLVRRPPAETVIRLALAGNSNTLIIGTIGGATMIAALVTVRSRDFKGWWPGLVAAAAFGAGTACVMLSNTRSVLLALIYSLPMVYFLLPAKDSSCQTSRAYQKPERIFTAVIVAMLVAAPIGARAFIGSKTLELSTKYAIARVAGAASLFGDTRYERVDASTQGRIDTIQNTFNGITWFGEGISAQQTRKKGASELAVYPHFTYLQVAFDFGIFGLVVYTILHAVIPIYLIILRLRNGVPDATAAFVIIYYLYSHIDHFTHHTPYTWLASMPVALVYCLLFNPSAPAKRQASFAVSPNSRTLTKRAMTLS